MYMSGIRKDQLVLCLPCRVLVKSTVSCLTKLAKCLEHFNRSQCGGHRVCRLEAIAHS